MKLCSNCTYATKEVVQGPQGYGHVYVCNHPECCHPVDGSLLPCELVRKQDIFCGFSARYYAQKPAEIQPEQKNAEGGLIALK